MGIIHLSNLEEFLTKFEAGICCAIKEASDTHFSRVYINLQGLDASNRQIQLLLAGYQNFVSDYNGRKSSIEKAIALFHQIKQELASQGVELEETPNFAIKQREEAVLPVG